MTTRRQFLKGSLIAGGSVVAAPSFLAACASGSAKEVVFADYGGTTGKARRDIFFDPFEKETGIKVSQANADPAKYQMMGTGKIANQWDGLDAENFLVARYYNQDLLAKLPKSVARADYVESPFSDYATAGYNQSFNIGYSEKLLGTKKPSSWADFWDVKQFPGKRAIPGFTGGIVEAALIADGVSKEKLFPLDFDRAFAKLDELRSHTLIFKDFGEGQQMLQSDSASMALLPNGRVVQLIDQKRPIGVVWNEALLMKWVGAPVMKNSPHKENMFKLLDFMTTPERQVEFAKVTGYGPVLAAAYEGMDPALAEKLPGSPAHLELAVLLDAASTAKQLDDYNTKLTKWLAK